ncbi:cytochrome P450 monooxygenase pc-3 [Auricularia subglabra TFB-10046 SS5]|nr:cytochrome P450 monooxygenase pc-3 [Auricularia subglabra TFB-10046 SS5]
MALKSRFLLHSVAKALVLPPALAHLLLRCLVPPQRQSSWLSALVYALSIPLAQYLRSIPEQRARRRDMARLGAHPIPRVRGWLPGNLDVLWDLVISDGDEYCAETMRRHADQLGPTFDMGILWASQHVLATSFNDFVKGVKFRDMFDLFLGQGIFTTDGDQWRQHRQLLKPFFSRERITDYRCFELHSSKMLSVLAMYAHHGDAVDIQDLFGRFSMDVGTDFLFGRCVKSLDAVICKDEAWGRFSGAFNEACFVGANRVRIGSLWPVFEIFGDRTAPAVKIIDDLIGPIIDGAMAKRGQLGDVDEMTFLDYMVSEIDDPKLVRAEVLNILLAARDTMASVLTFTIYCLTQHADVQAKLRAEIERVVGDRTPTSQEIRNMRYLRAVLNEVLRLFPPVPFNIRRSVGSSALPSPLSGQHPLYMPSNVSITYCSLLLHRRTDIWGPSALTFDPERWLSPEGDTVNPEELKHKVHVGNPFAFLPFNAGPRICLGQQFAYAETSYLLVRMLQRVASIELAPDAQPAGTLPPPEWASSPIGRESVERIRPVSSLTLSAKGGLWVRARMKDTYSLQQDEPRWDSESK